jgi:molybdopterin/thiamine biosynthesis adenylyltransferase
MNWNYETAFSRNIGLVTLEEQAKIKNARVAIAGMGGVGGVHLITLVRMGFTKFNIVDFDHYEVGNFNRQFGSNIDTLGREKVEVMKEMALKINPELDIRVFKTPLDESNVPEFLKDVTVFVDGLDAFEIDIRRHVFSVAYKKGIWAVTAGPIGFGVSWIVFSPTGQTFDDYCGINDSQTKLEKFCSFIIALCPAGLHLPYLNFNAVDFKAQRGPSSMLSCQLCSGIVGAEVLKIVINRGAIRPAPYFHQYDAFRSKFKSGRVLGGGWAPWPRFKQKFLKNKILKHNPGIA